MYKWNYGFSDQEILQNQFTAYVKRAVHNQRIRYLQSNCKQMEISMSEIELYICDPHDEISAIFEKELLRQVLRKMQDKECYILLARIIDGKSIDEISAELAISYRAVTSILYRSKKKLREMLEEGDAE